MVTILALPTPSRATRDRAREALGRLIEVYVRSEGGGRRAATSRPMRAEVEVVLPDPRGGAAGADRDLRALELLGFLGPRATGAYSADEEREVIKRLKAFGYL